MIRLVGTVFLLTASVAAGSFAAEGVKGRLRALKQIRIMLGSLRLMIRYEALEVSEIIRRLSDNSELSQLSFITYLQTYASKCFDNGEMTFDELWEKAVSENSGELSAEDISVIMRTGKILGSCDSEGQLCALTGLCDETDRLISDAREQYLAKGKLYRALGAVAGAFIAIMLV